MIRYFILKPSQAAELVRLMDEDANTKIELRRKLKDDSEIWETVRDVFRRSEMSRWKIRGIIGMGLFDGLSRNSFRSLRAVIMWRINTLQTASTLEKG